MKLLFALLLSITNWYYIPADSPSVPVEVENVDLNLKMDELAVTFFALSDGEATLLQHGNGENILINAGGNETKAELESLLKLYNIKKISSLILTKEDWVNSDNLNSLIKDFGIKEIMVDGKTADILNTKIDQIKTIQFKVLKQGHSMELLPNLNCKVLYAGNQEDEGLDISLNYLKHQMLFLSSSSEAAQQYLLTKDLHEVNIVKIPHYARSGAISEQLIKHMDPQVAIIYESKTIKPCEDILEMFRDAWIQVYYTKKHGTVTMKFTDTDYEVITISNKKETN